MSHDTAPKMSAVVTAPADWYVDPALWQVERRNVFGGNWQFLCHESDVAAPRQWRADVLAGYPVVAVRGDDGILRGFHNVCRHRAGPLVKDEAGTCDGHLTCEYHGWKYMLDGRLRMARDFGAASDFDPRDYGLFPIRLAVWRGLVFAGLNEVLPDLDEDLKPLDARLGVLDWSGFKVGLRRSHLLDCNWKTYVENYLEGYHVPNVHPGLDAEILSDQYKVTVDGKVALHEVPPRSHDAVYDGVWAWLWPNVAINVYQRGLMIERMSPVGHDKTRLDYTYLTPGGETVAAETLAMSDQVTAEDKWIAERVQENLNAGVYRTGRLSPKHEIAVAAFQTWVRDALKI
ncbi:aromatic ring-hydroxylating dioxygenase subunit alpha [Asticcacaulis sp. AC402]|uniref:aromatic ring-hydroxylating oxygenase subunit alpha n=1 Tax=Asticcacaulis sp. AC402 TaxID=1282361 RepID=UPI0004CF6ABC|nr:SRPBCC family protein [Asticcacaulis sp. AC402]